MKVLVGMLCVVSVILGTQSCVSRAPGGGRLQGEAVVTLVGDAIDVRRVLSLESGRWYTPTGGIRLFFEDPDGWASHLSGPIPGREPSSDRAFFGSVTTPAAVEYWSDTEEGGTLLGPIPTDEGYTLALHCEVVHVGDRVSSEVTRMSIVAEVTGSGLIEP